MSEISQEKHLKNAGKVAAAAVEFEEYQRWVEAGGDEDDEQTPETALVALLPAAEFDLLGKVAAAGTQFEGADRYNARRDAAAAVEPLQLASLVHHIEEDEDGGSDDPSRGGAPALRPVPRIKGHGLRR